jgi:DNA-binding transcriptional LysR family regulator
MELRHLRYFIAVAEEGHITRAAERLGMQQPPLSRQIQAIEREVDAQLFRRVARGVELTDAGHAFFDNARAVLAQFDRTLETTRRTARGEQGQISVGYTGAAAFHPLVAGVIRKFRAAFPLVSVTLSDGFPHDLVARIGKDQIDVAFIRTPVADLEGVVMDPLLEEAVVAALPSEHPLARSKNGHDTALPLKALAGETFVIYGRPDGALTIQTNAVISACQAAGFNPRVGHVVPNDMSRLNLIASGLGVSVFAASLQRMNIAGVTFRRLKGASQLKVPLHLTSRRGEASPVVRQFLKLAKQTARNYHPDSGKIS